MLNGRISRLTADNISRRQRLTSNDDVVWGNICLAEQNTNSLVWANNTQAGRVEQENAS